MEQQVWRYMASFSKDRNVRFALEATDGGLVSMMLALLKEGYALVSAWKVDQFGSTVGLDPKFDSGVLTLVEVFVQQIDHIEMPMITGHQRRAYAGFITKWRKAAEFWEQEARRYGFSGTHLLSHPDSNWGADEWKSCAIWLKNTAHELGSTAEYKIRGKKRNA